MKWIIPMLASAALAACIPGCGPLQDERFLFSAGEEAGEDFSWPVLLHLDLLTEDEKVVFHEPGKAACRLRITNISDYSMEGSFRVYARGYAYDGKFSAEPMGESVETVPVPLFSLEGMDEVRVAVDCGAKFGVFRRVMASFLLSLDGPVEVKLYPLSPDSVLAVAESRLKSNEIDIILEVFSEEAEVISPARKVNLAPGGRGHFKYGFAGELPRGALVEASARWGREFGPGRSRHSIAFDGKFPRGVPRVDFPVEIDGDLSEWRGSEHIFLGKEDDVFPPGGRRMMWRGPEDHSARLYLGWDDENFYIAAAVSDDRHFNEQEGGSIWNGDSLQFALAPPAAGGFNMGLALAGGSRKFYQWAGADAAGKAGYAVKRCEDASKTYYEFKIPLEAVCIEPEAGFLFGFNAVFFDDDDGEGYDYWLQLSPGLAGGWDPSAFGRYVLVD